MLTKVLNKYVLMKFFKMDDRCKEHSRRAKFQAFFITKIFNAKSSLIQKSDGWHNVNMNIAKLL